MELQKVPIRAVSPTRFEPLIGAERAAALAEAAGELSQLLEGRRVWNLNSTAAGGGVAEMLQPLLAYSRGAGIDARWLVVRGDPDFFRLTKRLHHALHGMPGDGGSLGHEEQDRYREVMAANADALRSEVEAGDVVLLHDPQTAGLVAAMRDAGALVVWRSHIGTDRANDRVAAGWDFLRPHLDGADAVVFSRKEYVPEWMSGQARIEIIPPSIDPFSAKNEDMDPHTVRAVVTRIGLVGGQGDGAEPVFHRRDGEPVRVSRGADVLRSGPPPSADAPMVVQVSRWDPLKDMQGVMEAFADQVADGLESQLALVGPNVAGVADDPEGAEVLGRCIDAWRELPDRARSRVQLVCLPMADTEENAAMVNAIQRHAAVVAQKSLMEGFGLTVAEAMWKARPVVASAVGGIQDQITDGEHGVLVQDPSDKEAFGSALARLLGDPDEADRLGQAGRQRTLERFLGDRHLLQYGSLIRELVAS